MDMPYRTFAPGSSRTNERFEQLARSTSANAGSGVDKPSSRKRVNVVTFRPTPSPTDESESQIPAASSSIYDPLHSPSPNNSNRPTGRQSLRPFALTPSTSEPIIAPKFRRKANSRNGGTGTRGTSRRTTASQSIGPKRASQKTPAPPPPQPSTTEADPYAWTEEEEEEEAEPVIPSEFAVREEDEDEQDCVKPWFWPASREVPKAQAQKAPTTTSQPANQRQSLPTTATAGVVDKGFKAPTVTNGGDRKAVSSLAATTVVDKGDVYKVDETHKTSGVQKTLNELNYLINSLTDNNTKDLRCTSILNLAKKFLSPSTRDVVHAYGLLGQICNHLHDAPKDYSLGLCAAGMFFVLSRDKDPDFLTAESLGLLLDLLNAPTTLTDISGSSATTTSTSKYSTLGGGGGGGAAGGASRQARLNKAAQQMRAQVHSLLEALASRQQKRGPRRASESPTKSDLDALFARKKSAGIAALFSGCPSASAGTLSAVNLNTRHLRMNRLLTARDLVLEAILNFSTRRAAPWFKAGIRTGGGLDSVAEATVDAVDYFKDLCSASTVTTAFVDAAKNPTGLDDFSLDNLKRVSHYAKMLENMTYLNSENQSHLVRWRERALVDRLVQCIRLCARRLPRHAPPSVAWSTLLHRQQAASTTGGDQLQPSSSQTEAPVEGEDPAKADQQQQQQQQDFQPDQTTLLNCLLAVFRLLVNVSHSEYASDRLGGCPDLLEVTLDCLFHLPDRLPASRRFDLLVLILCLLANLCEHCSENRIRVVHLEVHSPESVARDRQEKANELDNEADEEEEEEEDVDGSPRYSCSRAERVPTVSALDEIVKLFLFREKKTLMHEFEQADEPDKEKRRHEEADSTTSSTTAGGLKRPKPPPSILSDEAAATGAPETIEEAGLKWRLIGANKGGAGRDAAGPAGSSLVGGTGAKPTKSSKRSRMRARRKRRRQVLLKRRQGGAKGPQSKRRRRYLHDYDGDDDAYLSSDAGEESEEDEEEEMDDDELCSDEDYGGEGSEDEDEEEEEEEEDYEEDEELCGGADVEFVAETQEEQEKLKERLSSAKQHMEDSVVAAYAALLLGCILQSSPRYAERIRSRLPEPGKFRPLAIMLAKLVSFLSLARGVETAGSESILRIVRVLEAQDAPPHPSTTSPATSAPASAPPVEPPVLRHLPSPPRTRSASKFNF